MQRFKLNRLIIQKTGLSGKFISWLPLFTIKQFIRISRFCKGAIFFFRLFIKYYTFLYWLITY